MVIKVIVQYCIAVEMGPVVSIPKISATANESMLQAQTEELP